MRGYLVRARDSRDLVFDFARLQDLILDYARLRDLAGLAGFADLAVDFARPRDLVIDFACLRNVACLAGVAGFAHLCAVVTVVTDSAGFVCLRDLLASLARILRDLVAEQQGGSGR